MIHSEGILGRKEKYNRYNDPHEVAHYSIIVRLSVVVCAQKMSDSAACYYTDTVPEHFGIRLHPYTHTLCLVFLNTRTRLLVYTNIPFVFSCG